MKDQHEKITGYRDLSLAEISAMNEIKDFEARWNGLVDRIRKLPNVDQRNISIAVTYGEETFMRAVRAVAQPERMAYVGGELCFAGQIKGISYAIPKQLVDEAAAVGVDLVAETKFEIMQESDRG